MKRVILVHGWDGAPEHGWFPWLKRELESRGFEVIAPQLPVPADPRPERWVPALAVAVGTPDADTYFVGHSMGCQAIARYLETLPEETRIGGVVYVAGFFKRLINLEDPESEATAAAWLSTAPDFKKLYALSPKTVAIFSDNDEWVSLDNVDAFRDELKSEIIIVPKGDHFNGDAGWHTLPQVLEAVLKISGE